LSVVSALGVAALVDGWRRAFAAFAVVNAAPSLLVKTPSSLPVGIAGIAVVRALRTRPALVLTAPSALVHRPDTHPSGPVRVAVE